MTANIKIPYGKPSDIMVFLDIFKHLKISYFLHFFDNYLILFMRCEQSKYAKIS